MTRSKQELAAPASAAAADIRRGESPRLDWQRAGDTGIAYTIETLLGIVENNDQKADFQGIEIKCKGVNEGEIDGTSKINIFHAARQPGWLRPQPKSGSEP